MKFSFHWIKGHQDDNTDSYTLTWDEYLNILVDSMAQSFNQEQVEGVNLYHEDDLDRTNKCPIKWDNNDPNVPHVIQSLLGKTQWQLINSQNTKEYANLAWQMDHRFHGHCETSKPNRISTSE